VLPRELDNKMPHNNLIKEIFKILHCKVYMTISWSQAFDSAFKFILYSLAWDIIGGILLFFSFAFGFGAILSKLGLTLISTSSNTSALLISFSAVLFILGLFFIFFGNYATFFKIIGNTIADEVEARQNRKTKEETKDSKPDANYLERLK
jgi:hypothetical protein